MEFSKEWYLQKSYGFMKIVEYPERMKMKKSKVGFKIKIDKLPNTVFISGVLLRHYCCLCIGGY